MYEANEGIPVPNVERPGADSRKLYPFDTMDVGEMFFVPNRTKNTMMSHASRMGRKLNRKFATRMVWMTPDGDGWELADANTEGAVQGIGVWRTE